MAQPSLTPAAFAQKWRRASTLQKAAAQEHFIDLYRMVGEPTPLEVGELDCAKVEPAICGTIFERGLDPDQRAQLGARYKGPDDIRKVVEPVIVRPLQRECVATQTGVMQSLLSGRELTNTMPKDEHPSPPPQPFCIACVGPSSLRSRARATSRPGRPSTRPPRSRSRAPIALFGRGSNREILARVKQASPAHFEPPSHSTVSRAFVQRRSGKIVIRVIDHYRQEVLKVLVSSA